MPNVQHIHLLSLLANSINDAVDMRLVTVKQVPDRFIFGSDRTPVRITLQTKNGRLQTGVPARGGIGCIGMNIVKQKN